MDPAPGETVLFEGHPSWRSILGFYLKGLLVALLAGGIAAGVSRIADHKVKAGWAGGAFVVIMVIVLVVGFVRRVATTYTISDRRLHIRRGIISRKVQETSLERVQNVNTTQNVIERLLGVGTVDFDTAGGGDYNFAFEGVGNPNGVMHDVDRAQQAARQNASAQYGQQPQYAQQPPPGQPGVPGQQPPPGQAPPPPAPPPGQGGL